jgi:predicted kinase
LKVTNAILENLDDRNKDQFYGTPRKIAESFIISAECSIFSAYFAEQEEREQLARLIAKYGVPQSEPSNSVRQKGISE